ncbi:ribosome maturation factor RimP [Cellulomonas endophytica]|uniref:ribosome maturation factor RimP n=1 Tax=Cellulomonas endophytica TaxID=2494735 RepID=UPI0010139C61|nr:ribosome maturation factor RimP [Cellulomonas endophytica]
MVAPTSLAVREVLEPVLARAGFVLEDATVRRTGGRSTVEVVVDLAEDQPGDLDLDRVAEASQLVSETLDAHAEVLPDPYTLEVSSRGATRPLTQRRHWVRSVGRTVRLELLDGRTVLGLLRAVELPATLVVVPEVDRGKGRPPRPGAPVTVALEDVRTGRVEVDLRGLGPVAEDEGAEDGTSPRGEGQED